MITYRLELSERELEIVLTTLGLQAEVYSTAGYVVDAKEARDLLVRLDKEADAQFAPT